MSIAAEASAQRMKILVIVVCSLIGGTVFLLVVVAILTNSSKNRRKRELATMAHHIEMEKQLEHNERTRELQAQIERAKAQRGYMVPSLPDYSPPCPLGGSTVMVRDEFYPASSNSYYHHYHTSMRY